MNVPQPFQYQGSKRALSSEILEYLPAKFDRMVEPFAGSAALSLASAARRRTAQFWLNDYNKPLADLLNLIINRPEDLADHYRGLWSGNHAEAIERFYQAREKFNATHDPRLLLYLMARCVKGAVRYNADGLFNQSPDNRRLGTKPTKLRENLLRTSVLLRGKTIVSALDYRDVLSNCQPSDIVYMDPPYQGVCKERDARYYSGISYDDFVVSLDDLNRREIRFLISYDGRTGKRTHGRSLPRYLKLVHVELNAGRSSQATLLGRDDITYESLYISEALHREIRLRMGSREESHLPVDRLL